MVNYCAKSFIKLGPGGSNGIMYEYLGGNHKIANNSATVEVGKNRNRNGILRILQNFGRFMS
jgi:hypothetical protein